MSYLLSQIWICLLLTALVAGLAGWLLGGGKRKIKQLEEQWQTQLARTENERDYYAGEVKNLTAIAEEREEMEERFIREKQSLENELEALQKGMKFKVDSSKKQEEKLTRKAQTLEERNMSLNAKVEEEQQVFSQRVAELEAGEEMAKRQIEELEERVNTLQAQLDEAHINLTETSNRLAEAEAGQTAGESGKAGRAALGAAALAAGAAATVATTNEEGTDSLIDREGEEYPVDVIEAIADEDAKRLRKLGVKTTIDLLNKASNKEKISLLAKSLGKESWVVRSWASVADLLRVRGIDAVDGELLELAGVATVQSLVRSRLDKLVDSVKVIHRHVGKTSRAPGHDEITRWIENATKLEPMLETNVDKL